MRLVNLNLRNYRKYADEAIDFPDGLIGIIGPNGVGKSTILEAIAWVLYGNPAARTTKEQIKRQGTNLTDYCEVELEIQKDERLSKIVRQMKGANFSSDAAVYTDKKLMARGTHATTEYITEFLGLDREAFFTSFFAKQKELNTLSDLRPAERKNLIIKMLGIDLVDLSIQQIRQDVRDLISQTEILRTTLKDITSLESMLALKAIETKNLQKELKLKEKREKDLAQARDETKIRFQKEEEKKENYQQLVQEYNITKSQLSSSTKNLEDVKADHNNLLKLKPLASQLESKTCQLEEIKKECQRLTELKTGKLLLEEKINQRQKLKIKQEQEKKDGERLKKQISLLSEIKKELKKWEKEIKDRKEYYEKAQLRESKEESEINRLEEEKKKLKEQRKNIEALGPQSKCPTCSRPLGDDYNKINAHFNQELSRCKQEWEQRKDHLKKIQEDIRVNKEILTKLEKEKENTKKKQDKLHITESELKMRKKSIKQIDEELSQLDNQIKKGEIEPYDKDQHLKLEKRLEQLSKNRDELIKIQANLERLPRLEKSITGTGKEIDRLYTELAGIEKEGRILAFSQDKYESIKKIFEDTSQMYGDFRLELKDMQHNLNLSNLEIDKLKKEISEDKEKQKQIKELTEKQQYLDKTNIVLSEFRKHLIGRIRPLLSQKASDFLTQITDGKYSAMELDEDYDIYIYDQGDKFLIDRFSGGEKDLANLCLRLAVSQLITESRGNSSEFVVLDEVFGSQDDERKSSILRALSKLNNQFRQILLITHIEDIKDQVEHVLNIKEDETGISHASLE